MITFLKGLLVSKTPTWIELDVGGVGYGLTIPLSTFDRLPDPGSPVRLSTYFHVREDGMSLFGFLTPQEREMFTLLLSVSGIGPKLSVALLSSLNEKQIQNAILTDDIKLLSSVHGVGKKTAERIILELRDKMHKKGVIAQLTPSSSSEGVKEEGPSVSEDAVSALVTLGYSQGEARTVIAQVTKESGDGLTIEALIREGLNRLMKSR